MRAFLPAAFLTADKQHVEWWIIRSRTRRDKNLHLPGHDVAEGGDSGAQGMNQLAPSASQREHKIQHSARCMRLRRRATFRNDGESIQGSSASVRGKFTNRYSPPKSQAGRLCYCEGSDEIEPSFRAMPETVPKPRPRPQEHGCSLKNQNAGNLTFLRKKFLKFKMNYAIFTERNIRLRYGYEIIGPNPTFLSLESVQEYFSFVKVAI